MTITELAAMMNVSEAHVTSFVEMLRPRIAAGMEMEAAILDVRRAVEVMNKQAFEKRRALRDMLIEGSLYEDLRAAA